jgi:hypothetical protein
MTPMLGIMASSISGSKAITGNYYSISTATVTSGGTASITFSSIPSTYTHLQIRGIGSSPVSSGVADTALQFNGDTAGNYNIHWLYTFGSGTPSSGNYTASATNIDWGYATGSTSGTSSFGGLVMDILDYKNTNKYKTTRSFAGENDATNSTGNNTIVIGSGLWRSTSAINSITLYLASSNTFSQYTQYALYGIN